MDMLAPVTNGAGMPGAPAAPPAAPWRPAPDTLAPAPHSLHDVATVEVSTLAAMAVEHASRPGPTTSEFWAVVLAPLVTFVLSYVAALLVASGTLTDGMAGQVVPLLAATVTGAASAWSARAYAQGRSLVKSELAKLGQHQAPPAG